MSKESRNIEVEIILGKMAAVGMAVDGYNAANTLRSANGNSVAYGSSAFFKAADKMRGYVKRLEAIKAEIEQEEEAEFYSRNLI